MAELCLHIPVSVKDALREQSGPRSFMEREHRLKKDNLSVGFVQLASFPQEIGTFEEKKVWRRRRRRKSRSRSRAEKKD